MFKDQITGKQSKLGEKINKIVIQTREKTYENYDQEADEMIVSRGWEICKEVNATQEGLAIWNSWSAEQKEAFVKFGTALPIKYGTRR
jgi:hypothetical protein